MLRIVCVCCLAFAGCVSMAAGQGTTGDVSWSFVINNTLPPSGSSGGGLLVVVTYADGDSASYVVAAGESLRLEAEGASVSVEAQGNRRTVTAGQSVYYGASGWSAAPSASG